MPQVVATVVSRYRYSTSENKWSHKFTAASVAVSSVSSEIKLEAHPAGKIRGFRIACLSQNFDLSIRDAASITAPSNSEIYKVTGCNLTSDKRGLDIDFHNVDDEAWLYFYLTNNDGSNVTGTIQIELIFDKL